MPKVFADKHPRPAVLSFSDRHLIAFAECKVFRVLCIIAEVYLPVQGKAFSSGKIFKGNIRPLAGLLKKRIADKNIAATLVGLIRNKWKCCVDVPFESFRPRLGRYSLFDLITGKEELRKHKDRTPSFPAIVQQRQCPFHILFNIQYNRRDLRQGYRETLHFLSPDFLE
ncbi:hypothetical protein SDC9_166330 [bioreactor metagenome]|uniref:Uncharacterized protein n=1 Tax=bioreactor metagenome TaxID=1076179 RepID=A0A645FWZ8_9ZZZZ